MRDRMPLATMTQSVTLLLSKALNNMLTHLALIQMLAVIYNDSSAQMMHLHD